MIKLSSKEKQNLAEGFNKGFDYNTLIEFVDLLEKKKEEEELLMFVKYYLQGYYIHNVDNDKLSNDKYTENWEHYKTIRDFVLAVYQVKGIKE
jgi:hypothetical protein